MGYGHSTPYTVGGKIFTMIYATIGIPLGLVMFQSIGERLNKFSSIIIKQVKKLLKCERVEATEVNLICVVTTLSTVIITSGAAVFSHYEDWTYFESTYYCFITLTTIGFGDYVALQNGDLNSNPRYVVFSLIFILFGLTVVAASVNLLVLRFVTMNTEDERKDELEAMRTAQGAVRLEGDVITTNGSIISGHLPREAASLSDVASVCSCKYCDCWSRLLRRTKAGRARARARSRARLHTHSLNVVSGSRNGSGRDRTTVTVSKPFLVPMQTFRMAGSSAQDPDVDNVSSFEEDYCAQRYRDEAGDSLSEDRASV
ncbi:unnamed protein product [Darwinula stevensoni]|uniref:Potassium channel domain-containing protein n=1 Tax=Darwinula stevensoni TaxID=69355 RepID=A0A7R9AI89_9CRUS|nr:unnamed protein product [Darwinula stevensoni]CAG0905283.1 unnamed protein product [Darwinula stevensoni]